MKRKSNKKYFIVLLLIAVLLLAVGYAAFSDQLNITGSASANGKFDIVFAEAKVLDKHGIEEKEGDETTQVKCDISDDKKTLTVKVPGMKYPGAGARFEAIIKNNGTIPAKVKAIRAIVNGEDVTEQINDKYYNEIPGSIIGLEHIKIAGLGEFNAKLHDETTGGNNILEAGKNCGFTFTVYWDENATTNIEDTEEVEFTLEIDYEMYGGDGIVKNPTVNYHEDFEDKNKDNFAGAAEGGWQDPRYDYITPEEIYKLEMKGYQVDPVIVEDNVTGIKVTKKEGNTVTVVENWKEILDETSESTGSVGVDPSTEDGNNVTGN